MAIGVILCPQELRIRGIVSVKKEAMYYKSENIGGDEQNCPAQNETFHVPSRIVLLWVEHNNHPVEC